MSTFYTVNLVSNPSFQLGMFGYAALNSASAQLDTSNVLYGAQSLLIQCPGDSAGEGVITASGNYLDDELGSASLYLTGTGSVTVSAVMNPGQIVVASAPVMLTGKWARVSFSDIVVSAGQSVYLTVETTTAQSCAYWISGVQVEESTPAHPYCDGDQPGCIWLDGVWGGTSAQLYDNPAAATSVSYTNSNVVVISYGDPSVAVPVESESYTYSPVVYLSLPGPTGAVTDFSVAMLTDSDPALSYPSWNNGGISSSGGAVTPWGIFIPPKEYVVSGGEVLYPAAAYFAQGWWFPSAPTDTGITMTNMQAEVLPLTTGYSAPSPSAFDFPRDIHSVIVADRINYVVNPSFEVSTADWTATGTAVISQDGTKSAGQLGMYDDEPVTTGTHSLKVQVNSAGDGAETVIPDLITGRTYMASLYVQVGSGIGNIAMSVADSTTSVLSSGGTGYGDGAYGEGLYGGITPGAALPEGVWYRISTVFTATSDSHVLDTIMTPATGVSYPTYFWLDAVMVEEGEILEQYFDGSFEGNYTWDSISGSPGLARSYYYDQMPLKQQAVLNILARHTPLGISALAPQYSVAPIS